MSARDDETLLRLYARQGDEAAFRELARRYGGFVYAACLRDLRRPEMAEDAAQATFLLLARKAGRVRVRTTLVPWLATTAKLVCRNVLRAERRRPEVPLTEAAAPGAVPDDGLFQALDALSEPEREAVVLRFVQGLTLAEVGRAQGVSEDAARMRVQRALKRLRKEYVPALAAPASLAERLATIPLPKPGLIMTTPLLLAACGALVAAGATTTTFRPSPPASKPVLPPVQVFAAVAATPEPPPAVHPTPGPVETSGDVPYPTLDKPFTLVYRLTLRNVRTKAMNEAEIARIAKDDAADVERDQMTQVQMDEALARLRAHLEGPPEVETITLMFDGRTLLYQASPGDWSDPQPNVNLFDGEFTYHFAPRDPASKYGPQGFREQGTLMFATWNMPYIGPAYPFFPLTQGDSVLALPYFDKKLVYAKGGSFERGPGGTVARAVFGKEKPPEKEVVLSGWTAFQGTYVAQRVVMSEREFQGPFDGLPSMRREYDLVSAQPLADAARLDPNAYVEDGESFTVGTDSNRNTRFTYERAKGTLQQQIEAFMRGAS